jgi:hypothetical protein
VKVAVPEVGTKKAAVSADGVPGSQLPASLEAETVYVAPAPFWMEKTDAQQQRLRLHPCAV